MKKPIKQRLEDFFAALTRFQFRHGKWILLVWILVFAGIWSNIRFLNIDTSTEGFFHPDDPILLEYEQFRDDHGRDELIILAIESEQIFSTTFLEKLVALHEEIDETVPFLEEVTSMANARATYGDEDSLIVEDLLEEFPETEAELAMIKQRVLGNPMYLNMLISEDAQVTTMTIKTSAYQPEDESEEPSFSEIGVETEETEQLPLTDEQNHELIETIQTIVGKYHADDFQIHVAGSPIITDNLKATMQDNMKRFMGSALGCIAFLLFLLLRRVSGVILPLVIVISSLLSTLGLMGLTGTAIKIPTQILPSFILAVGIGAAVHILSIFFVELRKGESKEAAMVEAMSHSALPILMTSFTTAVGLWSFSTAEMAPIADLGIFAGVGVLICLMTTLVLLPTLVAVFPIKTGTSKQESSEPRGLDRFLLKVAHFNGKVPLPILLASLLVFIFFAVGISKVQLAHSPVTWLPENGTIRQASDWIDDKMKGSVVVEFLIDSGKVNGFYDPEMLNHLDAIGDYAKNYTRDGENKIVGNVISIAGMLKEIHKALNANNPEFYAIPENPELIPQEFFLFANSGADDLEDVIDSQFQIARFTIKVPWANAAEYVQFINDMQNEFAHRYGGEVQITTTGLMYLLASSIDLMMHSTILSYLIAGVLISLLMVLMLGSWKYGLVSMYPNLFPIVVTIGMMGWVGIPMDMFSMLIGSIAIGLVVDDTIHFMHQFRRYYDQTGSAQEAVNRTLTSTGRALLLTTLVLATGFGVFVFSAMVNLFYFGLLTAFTLVLALMADLVIAPALMLLLNRKSVVQQAGELKHT